MAVIRQQNKKGNLVPSGDQKCSWIGIEVKEFVLNSSDQETATMQSSDRSLSFLPSCSIDFHKTTEEEKFAICEWEYDDMDRKCAKQHVNCRISCIRENQCIWKCEHGIRGLSDAMRKRVFVLTETRSNKQRLSAEACSFVW